jgi:uncharacterized protein YcfJ
MNSNTGKKVKFQLVMLALMLGVSGTSLADRKHHERGHDYAWGKVLEVTPMYRQVRSSVPVEECWQQPVRHVQQVDHSDIAGSTLAGGILGGIIGHQIGKGNGRKIATAFGTIIGAQLGHDAARGAHGESVYSYTRYDNVCETQHKVSYEQVLDGYRVRYSYRGDQYETTMAHKPGKKIKLQVSVQPVANL